MRFFWCALPDKVLNFSRHYQSRNFAPLGAHCKYRRNLERKKTTPEIPIARVLFIPMLQQHWYEKNSLWQEGRRVGKSHKIPVWYVHMHSLKLWTTPFPTHNLDNLARSLMFILFPEYHACIHDVSFLNHLPHKWSSNFGPSCPQKLEVNLHAILQMLLKMKKSEFQVVPVLI